VQVYLSIKENSVEGLLAGIYYYHPVRHALVQLQACPVTDVSIYAPDDRVYARDAGLSMFLIGQLNALRPTYQELSPIFATLDAGYLSQLLTSKQAYHGLQLYSARGVDFARVAQQFACDDGHHFVHCLLAGRAVNNESSAQGPMLTALPPVHTITEHFKSVPDFLHREDVAPLNGYMQYDHLNQPKNNLAQPEVHLRPITQDTLLIDLSEALFPEPAYRARFCRRTYQRRVIPLATFRRFLALFSLQKRSSSHATIGAGAAIQVYLYIKPQAVEGLQEGGYFYDRERQTLSRISEQLSLPIERCHTPFNRPQCMQAGFSLFLLADQEQLQQQFGVAGLHYGLLEVGAIGQLLLERQTFFDLGLVPIGGLNFNHLRVDFKLKDNQILLHSFMGGFSEHSVSQESARIVVKEVTLERRPRIELEHRPSLPAQTDIAIVGLSGRYPGANVPADLWHLLSEGQTAIRQFPEERRQIDGYMDKDPQQRKIYTSWGGYLSNIDRFDNMLFNITPAEARILDPQERLFLEIVWECLENAGYTSEQLLHSAPRVGVFVGAMWNDYQNLGIEQWEESHKAPVTSLHSSIANRVSYYFNLQGPSIALDTSCSSALTALHFACENIRHGECDAAIAGGINIISHPYHQGALCGQNLLARDDKAYAFGSQGTGLVVGEGVGSVLLRPRADAERSGDHIYGVIKGSTINHSGHTQRFGMPNPDAQSEGIRHVLSSAQIAPDTISYIEAAATGSSLADASEIKALIKAFRSTAGATEEKYCAIGSIKPNIGHLEAASAMSQLTKVLLQFQHHMLAPSMYAEPQNPLIDLEGTPFYIVRSLTSWQPRAINHGQQYLRRALINSFGATGSYGHLIVEEYNK
jgi:3-oxoacyl-(acyl-carrier-protein) synthase